MSVVNDVVCSGLQTSHHSDVGGMNVGLVEALRVNGLVDGGLKDGDGT